MTVLWWLSNKRMYKQYVRHRIDEIRQLTNNCSWRHCPGKLNPADLPSRGVSIGNLVNSSLWWDGPKFLQAPEHSWPPKFNGEFSEAARDEMGNSRQMSTKGSQLQSGFGMYYKTSF